MAHPGGRPLKFNTPEEVETAISYYFEEEKEPTLAGLAVYLGISRSTLYNYEEKDQFLDIIKKAREKVESVYEKRLVYGNTPTGVIFALKNMSWRDKTETELTGANGGPVVITGMEVK